VDYQNQDKATQQLWASNVILKHLARLAGEWNTEITYPADPNTVIRGQASIKWLAEGPFLAVRSSVDHPDFPTGTMILGGDDESESYSMLYFDSRGIARLYEMSLSEEVWQLRRNAPGFFQRYTGTFSADGNTIIGSWEQSSDGSTWALDFNLTYKRAGHGK
jgi:hypothetical protein